MARGATALPIKDVVILDLDNTIWDWFHIWHEYFTTLFDGLAPMLEVDREELLDQIRLVHQTHGTSEYAFLLHELPAVLEKFGDPDAINYALREVIHDFRRKRKRATQLYTGVGDFLHYLKPRSVQVLGYTESLQFYSMRRFKTLALDGVFDRLYSPPDHSVPETLERHYDHDYYKLHITEHHLTPKGALKPDVDILRSIIEDANVDADQCVYVGDSLMKDIAMAQDAGVLDAWAEYGAVQHKSEYDLLRRVSHWTQADVERERSITKRDIVPTITLSDGLGELLQHVRLGHD